jgi:hypothetical protein
MLVEAVASAICVRDICGSKLNVDKQPFQLNPMAMQRRRRNDIMMLCLSLNERTEAIIMPHRELPLFPAIRRI